MPKVTSSNIEQIDYENGNLIVEFKNNSKYLYKNVEREIYEKMLLAESVGKYFHSTIKGKYEYEKQ